ncbi:nucleotidyltransferase domain-containing protein [Streptomyces sp. SID4934]|uniref:DNA polymerase subunit beta n=1 Tax=unclassified Streptomyces TaxID=2593676 RepID=UPI00081D5308|nr:DNA polymerase subunit beta [Streptomyces sp. ScaeMP-6W]MYQ70547.1 nucleotidyltransferase domain-containing protein [Streptomyces sp. SID4934]SCD52445.1 lincosamide nucleotidyltransferase [Streptomyces sp. ScaeMP-6W]
MPRTPAPRPSASPALDARVALLRRAAHAEPRLEGVLLYGSWTTGEADAYSDIEAYLFLGDGHADTFDGPGFLRALGRPALAHTNQFGILALVFEDDLMRGEFHFEEAGAGIAAVEGWQGMVHLPDPDAAVLLDRTGRLTKAADRLTAPLAPEPVESAAHLTGELANWTLMLAHLLARREDARAHNLLHAMVAPLQLKLCRLLRGTTDHWLTPSRAAERDLPAADLARYTATTAPLAAAALRAAARASWQWSRELAAEAHGRWGTPVPEALHARIAGLLARD